MDNDNRLLMPYDDAMHALGGIGITTRYELFADHQLEQVKIGRRAFVTTASIKSYVERLSAKQPA